MLLAISVFPLLRHQAVAFLHDLVESLPSVVGEPVLGYRDTQVQLGNDRVELIDDRVDLLAPGAGAANEFEILFIPFS